jgi:NADPH-dependent 2,4-dienoyl-CoA reductase/sulfur reductase-like enzyme
VHSVTIVGAGLAGHASAKALRTQGFAGRITVIGGEQHRPYDRPPLSKDFLAGIIGRAELALEADHEDLGVEWMLGSAAVHLDLADRRVDLADGGSIVSDVVIISTGSSAKTLGRPRAGVHTLRSVDDAINLSSELVPGARLVVVGSGFVGLEVASTARDLGLDVIVLGSSEWPLSRIFGDTIATVVQRLHERRGVVVRNRTSVLSVLGRDSSAGGDGTDRVTGVRLGSGEEVSADVVVVGIGSVPCTAWLEGSGLEIDGGVVCDSVGGTAAAGIFAVGDCSAWFDPVRGRAYRVEHWTDSRDRASMMVAAILDAPIPESALRPSYLWSDQCGVRIQFAGRLLGGEEVTVEAGSIESGDPLAVYSHYGDPVAVVGIDQQKLVAQWRKKLTARPDSLPSSALTTVPVSPTRIPQEQT